MENKTMHRTLYRVLRKTGVPRKKIELDASFNDDLNFDQLDWTLFIYYLENTFKISVNDDEVYRLSRIKDSFELIRNIA